MGVIMALGAKKQPKETIVKKKVKVADVEVVRPDNTWSKDKIKTWLDDHGIKYHWNSGKETLLSKVK